MYIEPYEYAQLKRELEKLDNELNSYIYTNQLVYTNENIINLKNKIIVWQALVKKSIETARRQKTKDDWTEKIKTVQNKIALIEKKYLGQE